MTTIHFVDGEKGGVGKSFFAKVLVEYFLRDLDYATLPPNRRRPRLPQLETVFNGFEKFSKVKFMFLTQL